MWIGLGLGLGLGLGCWLLVLGLHLGLLGGGTGGGRGGVVGGGGAGGGVGRGLLALGRVVEDVQAASAGGDDVGHELGALGADVAQAAAVGVQVGELLLHRAAGQRAQRSGSNGGKDTKREARVFYLSRTV